jgi:hypothetical protein
MEFYLGFVVWSQDAVGLMGGFQQPSWFDFLVSVALSHTFFCYSHRKLSGKLLFSEMMGAPIAQH